MKLKIHHSRPTISSSYLKALTRVIKSGYVASGALTQDFQNKFTRLLKVKSSIATNSGTSALHLALLALGIQSGDEVIIPSFVCTSVLNAVFYLGAKPKIVDINTSDFNLSLKETKKNISTHTKAIILPHMFGKPADLEGFLKLGIPLIENCAHSLGARYNGRPTGSFGDISIFSFYATKMITTGYGGMVCSKNKNLINKIRNLIDVDEREDYKMRFNYKMSDINACLGIIQLSKLSSFISQRREIAKFYSDNLKSRNIRTPEDLEKNHIYFRYVIRIKHNIDRVVSFLQKNSVEIKRPVFKPLHQYLKLDKRKFPNSEAVFNSAVSLPIYPGLGKSQAKFIVDNLNKVID